MMVVESMRSYNEDGFVLGGAILISAILILAGVLALWTSTTEVQVVRNEGLMIRELYDAEGGIIDALVNYNTGSTDWLTDDFLIVGPTQARKIVISNGNTTIQVGADSKRIDVAKEVVNDLINMTTGVRFGVMRFNNNQGGRLIIRPALLFLTSAA